MALLQIAEPGQSSAPHEHRIAIGIDLGTTHSLVATVLSGKAKVLHDEQGRVLLPADGGNRQGGRPLRRNAVLSDLRGQVRGRMPRHSGRRS